MHNWWIAAFEQAGIWTHEQAEHVSNNIKTSIHRDNYADAFNELKGILAKGTFGTGAVTNVEAEITALKSQVRILTEELAKKVEAEVKKVEKKVESPKVVAQK